MSLRFGTGKLWHALCENLKKKLLLGNVAPEQVAAIILEPILGEGGFIIPPDAFLQEMGWLCDKYGILLIADEIQTGYARTGLMFACEHWSVRPDIVAMPWLQLLR